MFAAIARAEPLLRKEADTPYGQSAAAKTPACRKKTGKGPAPASRGLSVKNHLLRGGTLRQKTGNGACGPASPKFTVSMSAAKPTVISRLGFCTKGGMA